MRRAIRRDLRRLERETGFPIITVTSSPGFVCAAPSRLQRAVRTACEGVPIIGRAEKFALTRDSSRRCLLAPE